MLLRKNRGGTENRHLTPGLHNLESSANGNLRLSKAHVSTDETVHRESGLKVALNFFDGERLARRLHPRESALHLCLPRRIRTIRSALDFSTLRVEFDQISRKSLGLFFCLAKDTLPFSTGQAVEFGILVPRIQILLNPI